MFSLSSRLGIGMVAAWGIIIPLGMSIALMCKSICPGKGYVYVGKHHNKLLCV